MFTSASGIEPENVILFAALFRACIPETNANGKHDVRLWPDVSNLKDECIKNLVFF